MENRVNYIFVGLFVLLLGVGLVAILLWLAGGRYERGDFDTYLAYMSESVTGLNINAPVKYRGVDVGQVRRITLDPQDPERVRLSLEIQHGTPIKEDTVAILTAQGITGIAFINLTHGSRDAATLRPTPETPIPVIRTAPSLLQRVDTSLSGLTERFSILARRAEQLLDDDNLAAFKHTLSNIEQLTAALNKQMPQLERSLGQAETTLQSINTASRQLPGLIEHVDQASLALPELLAQLKTSAVAVEKMADDVSGAADSAGVLVEDGRRFARTTLPQTGQLVTDMREIATTLRRLLTRFEQQPNMLLLGNKSTPKGPGE